MWIDRRWLGIGIAVSLLLNVFLIGIVAGHLLMGRNGVAHPAVAAGPLVPKAHVRALPDDEKHAFESTMNEHREAIRAARRQHRAARLATEMDIAAPTFDRVKITADFSALREANVVLQEAVNTALVDSLTKLSPQARAALVAHARPADTKAPAATP